MTTYKIQPLTGGLINTVREAKAIASAKKVTVEFKFDGMIFLVNSATEETWVLNNFFDAKVMGWHKIGPTYPMWYDIDTRIELYTRQLYSAANEKCSVQNQIEKSWEKKRLNIAKTDGILEGYTKLSLYTVRGINGEFIYGVNISVIAGSSMRTFFYSYDSQRGGHLIYFLPFNCDCYTLKFSYYGYKDMYLHDLKVEEGKTNHIEIDVLMQPES